MSSFFATGTSRRNSPAWCKKGMFTGIDPMINALPATLSAYARWTGTDSAGSYNVIETFKMRRNPTGNGWVGESSKSGTNVLLEILDSTDPDRANVTVTLRFNTTPHDWHTWLNVPTNARPPWGTTTLNYADGSTILLTEAQALA